MAIKLGDLKSEVSAKLRKADIASFSIDADLIIETIIGLSRVQILTYPEKMIPDNEVQEIRELTTKRMQRYPIAYITGVKGFYGLNFFVNNKVLIPRPETEHLVEAVLEMSQDINTVLDLCCGSGCIGITLKKNAPHLNVTLSDISEKALQTTRKNAKHILKEKQVTILRSDLFENIKSTFDIITCNPPYITEEEYQTLSKDVHYEPKQALLAGEKGLDYYEKISLEAKQFLNSGGMLFFEIGEQQKNSIVEIYSTNNYIFHKCITDYSGKPRILIFRI